MKVLITTGGTGGHIYPALALADQLKNHHKDIDIMFIGNNDRMETTIIPATGYRFVGIKAASFNNSNNKLTALQTLYRSYRECLTLVNEYSPDVIIGFGGYVTVPVIMAGHHLKIKTIIHEQNSIAGMANKALGHFVDKVVTVYPSVNSAFNPKKTFCLGNPRESAVLGLIRDRQILSQFGIDPARKTLLIVMGSLGSQSVNEKMVSILQEMKKKDYNVIYVTGKNNYDDFIKEVQSEGNVRIVPYIDQFPVAANCNLIVSRGGATSACEYMALGLPSIIIPSTYVPNNHQFLNAKSMLDNGASLLIEEKDLTMEKLVSTVDELINDDMKLQEMSEAARRMSHPNAAEDFVKLIYETTGAVYEGID